MANSEKAMQKITPFLWFDNQAEEAVNLYTSIFNNSKTTSLMRMPDGKVLTAGFQLNGQSFAALNGGPKYKFNPAISFFVVCETEAEVDAIWSKITEGGSMLMPLNKYPWSEWYGWGQDRFGLSWQVMLNKNGGAQKFIPCLMFAGDQLVKADEAVIFYTSIFENSKIGNISRYTAEEPAPEGAIKYAEFNLNGQTFSIMGSAMPHNFSFNKALSFVIDAPTQEAIDYYWSKLTEGGGSESRCGWLKDKYGVSWQVVPPILSQLLGDKDPVKAQRVMQAMLKMSKIIIADLEQAANQG